MNRTFRTFLYVITDWATALVAWISFFVYRKYVIEPEKFGYQIPVEIDKNFFIGALLVPSLWLILYAMSGSYHEVYRKSRLRELVRTFNTSLIGVLILFFSLLLDDEVSSYKSYYFSIAALFTIHFLFTSVSRFILVYQQRRHFAERKIGFNTLIIGNSHNAITLYNELESGPSQGYFIRGFVHTGEEFDNKLQSVLPDFGHWKTLPKIVKEKNIEEVIIAIESSQHEMLNHIVNMLEGEPVRIKIIPDMYDILSGSVKMNQLFGTPLIEVNTQIMPDWQQALKRLIDVLMSSMIILLFWPFYLFVAIAVKMDSKGPIFYNQERIGFRGKPFKIHKFRTMRVDAENGVPQLSSTADDRRTKLGIWLRKFRIDELPQVWNVLIGEMSMVGPR
ncbi:MAG: exopolysaccharide biosynthesis polyprenyl glycosylphosphotransferase, partial [Bacteroidetes bacterium]|nr:exopolysaccharide biosynthesis polyprenyl glycosylphosphotransferase [Bacteroidota bacterium]